MTESASFALIMIIHHACTCSSCFTVSGYITSYSTISMKIPYYNSVYIELLLQKNNTEINTHNITIASKRIDY